MNEFTVQVNVTQEDIDKGVRARCNECPLARATLRSVSRGMDPTGRITGVVVGVGYAGFDVYDGEWYHGWVCLQDRNDFPPDANRFINDFDNQRPVEPTSFQLTFRRVTPAYKPA
jgi:hypothetical protein